MVLKERANKRKLQETVREFSLLSRGTLYGSSLKLQNLYPYFRNDWIWVCSTACPVGVVKYKYVEQKRNVILEACLIPEHVIYCHSYKHDFKYLQISKILIKQSINLNSRRCLFLMHIFSKSKWVSVCLNKKSNCFVNVNHFIFICRYIQLAING